MTKLIKISFFALIVFLSSCKTEKRVSNITTVDFLNQISLEKWNKETIDFINNHCKDSLIELYNKDSKEFKYITKRGDTLRTFNEHLNLYLKNRKALLLKLIENESLFKKYTGVLVIKEDYFGVFNPKISYTISNDKVPERLIFYFESDGLKKVDTLDSSHRIHDYDSIISKQSECINQFRNILNAVSFETVFHLDDEDQIKYSLKLSYFGTMKD